jgi:uncharacterized protein (UPF0333 family)
MSSTTDTNWILSIDRDIFDVVLDVSGTAPNLLSQLVVIIIIYFASYFKISFVGCDGTGWSSGLRASHEVRGLMSTVINNFKIKINKFLSKTTNIRRRE